MAPPTTWRNKPAKKKVEISMRDRNTYVFDKLPYL